MGSHELDTSGRHGGMRVVAGDAGDTAGSKLEPCARCLAIAQKRISSDIWVYRHRPGGCPLNDDGSLRPTDDDHNRTGPSRHPAGLRADNDPDGGICQW
jgi:hypothetical protein